MKRSTIERLNALVGDVVKITYRIESQGFHCTKSQFVLNGILVDEGYGDFSVQSTGGAIVEFSSPNVVELNTFHGVPIIHI